MSKAVRSWIAAPAAAPYTPILDACPYTSPHAGTMGLHCTHVGSGVTHCGVRLRGRWFGTALTHQSRGAVLRTSGRVATTRPLSVAAQHIGPLTCITACGHDGLALHSCRFWCHLLRCTPAGALVWHCPHPSHSRGAVLRTSGRVATTRPLSVAAQHRPTNIRTSN